MEESIVLLPNASGPTKFRSTAVKPFFTGVHSTDGTSQPGTATPNSTPTANMSSGEKKIETEMDAENAPSPFRANVAAQ